MLGTFAIFEFTRCVCVCALWKGLTRTAAGVKSDGSFGGQNGQKQNRRQTTSETEFSISAFSG